MTPYGIQGDAELHHVDHLGLICHLMEAPLLFTDEEKFELAQKFYPKFKKELVDWQELRPDRLVDRGDVIFYTNFFGQESSMPVLVDLGKKQGKLIRSVCCPHGNSDKGHSTYYMEAFENEDIVLIYGQRMLDFFREKKVVSPSLIRSGNYRLQYYQQEKKFFDDLAQSEIFTYFDEPKNFTILYAPTWEDWENGTSFFLAIDQLLNQLPTDYNLIIKCHPRLLETSLLKIWQLEEKVKNRSNVVIVTNYPHVYPLLEKADVYLGDMSSIGYDYLYFNRPLFFLNHKGWDWMNMPGLKLFHTGVVINPVDFDKIFQIIDQNFVKDTYSNSRQDLYNKTFDSHINLIQLKQMIKDACQIRRFS